MAYSLELPDGKGGTTRTVGERLQLRCSYAGRAVVESVTCEYGDWRVAHDGLTVENADGYQVDVQVMCKTFQ